MIISEEHRSIALKLTKENICTTPLDARSLDTIAQYMRYDKSVNDLIRRLSDVELNYVQIHAEADRARESFLKCKESCVNTLRILIDDWSSRGYIQQYFFAINTEHSEYLKYSYTTALEKIRNIQKTFTDNLMITSETSAQLQACSASFFEIYKESKLATYAAMLNKNVESILDCRSLSLQAHASSNESARSASYYLGISRIITTTISVVASMIIESANALSVDNYNEQENDRISTYKATSIIRSSISDLDKIRIHKL